MSHEECCSQLPMPVIAKSKSSFCNRIYPGDVGDGLKLSWAFNGLSAGQPVRFFLRPARQTSEPLIFEQTGNDHGCAQAWLPASILAPFVGKSVDIWSDVSQEDCTVCSSTLRLAVKRFKCRDLPRVKVQDLICENCKHWLDLGQLPGDARAFLPPWPLMRKGQKIWVRSIGQRTDQEFTFIYLLDGHEITDEQVVDGVNLSIPRWWLDLLMDRSTLELKVEVAFDSLDSHRCAHRFPRTKVRVRSALISLPAPEIDQSQAGTLNPHLVTQGATVRINWPGLRTSDWVCIHWGNSLALECKAGNLPGSLTFDVLPDLIREFLGRALDVWYTVVRDGRLLTSPVTVLRVLDLSDFSPLTVDRASGGVLDLNTFTETPKLMVAGWDFAKADDATWTKISGTDEAGSPRQVILRNAVALQDGEVANGIADELVRDMLQGFAIDSEVVLELWSSFDDKADLMTAKKFPPLTLRLITERFTDTEQFTGLVNELITEGQHTNSAAMMDIEFLSGAGQAGIYTYAGNESGMREGASIVLCLNQGNLTPPQRVRLRFRHGYLQLRFAWTWGHKAGKVFYCDAQDADLGSVDILGQDVGGALHQWIELSAPEHQRIYSVVFEVGDFSFLDFFNLIR
ncbi:hypothetical protein [Pseudomonas sp. HS6]|uniref:hypothetical protein n=1 Tax=Pseudomonas sp. HS6 TaxID=2850559 RepID=UPI002019BD16|nr:hypothetical protein [Pseudomonas sp. HS6]UQS13165.1 hypothetical protein JJN09_18255 [Pseudomonas sp. HS6]